MSANSRNLPTSNPTLQGRQTSQVLVGSHGVRSAISNTSTHPLLNPQRIANDYMSNIPQGNHVNTLTGQLAHHHRPSPNMVVPPAASARTGGSVR